MASPLPSFRRASLFGLLLPILVGGTTATRAEAPSAPQPPAQPSTSAATALPPLPVLDKVLFARLRNGTLHAESVESAGNQEQAGAVRGYAVCRCGFEVLWAVLTDHAQFPKFVPRVKAVEVSRRNATGERALQTVDATLSTLKYALDYAWDPRTQRIDFQLAEDTPHDLKAVKGHWQLWPLDGANGGKQMLIEYQSAVDVGRAVPGFIRGYLADRGVKDTIDAVRKRAEALSSASQQ